MKFVILLLLSAACASAQVTNYVTAAPNFRKVGGKLYNVDRSVMWTNLTGVCAHVRKDDVVVKTFTLEPEYGVGTRTRTGNSGLGPGIGTSTYLQPTRVWLRDRKVQGRSVIVVNFTNLVGLAVGQEISFRAMKTGTSDFEGEPLELWDCGTPHVVAVVSTNSPKRR